MAAHVGVVPTRPAAPTGNLCPVLKVHLGAVQPPADPQVDLVCPGEVSPLVTLVQQHGPRPVSILADGAPDALPPEVDVGAGDLYLRHAGEHRPDGVFGMLAVHGEHLELQWAVPAEA